MLDDAKICTDVDGDMKYMGVAVAEWSGIEREDG